MTDTKDTPLANEPICYLHIGMAKTGTSSIQDTLGKNRENPDFAYLNVGPDNHSRVIHSMFPKTPTSCFPEFKKLGWSNNEVSAYASEVRSLVERELETNSKQKFIISGESIISFDEDQLRRLCNFLDKYFTRICVVAYIRPPKSYMESIFQQRLKGGSRYFNLQKLYPFYQQRIEKFDRVFGVENVILRKFNYNLFPDGDVVIDFCRLIEISASNFIPLRINESLSLEAIALLFAYRKYGPRHPPGAGAVARDEAITAALRKLHGEKLSFSNESMSAIYEEHVADLNWIKHRTGFSLDTTVSASAVRSVSSARELLTHSVEGARTFVSLLDGKSWATIPNPKTPREAARVLHDFTVHIDSTLEGTFPLPSLLRSRKLTEQRRPNLLQRFRKWVHNLF